MNLKKNKTQKSSVLSEKKSSSVLYFIFGILLAVTITIISLVVCALILTYTSAQESIITPVSFAVTVVSSFFAGFISSKGINEKGLFYGFAAGIVYIMLIIAVLSFSCNEMIFTINRLIGIAVAVICAGAGGVLGINTKK